MTQLCWDMLATRLQAQRHGVWSSSGFFGAVATDSRRLRPGDLFVALRGCHHDGHHFVEQAVAAGASALLVEHPCQQAIGQLVVADCGRALGHLAALWRGLFGSWVIAVSGSNGKTTVKEMIAAILMRQGKTLASVGNENNLLGMPLNILRMRASHRYAVLEMGTSQRGEIASLSAILRPNIAVITNVGRAHLEGLGDLCSVAEEKGDLYGHLSATGVAVINADDRFADRFRRRSFGRRQFFFGLQQSAELQGSWQQGMLRMTWRGQSGYIPLPLSAQHHINNVLAATAVALTVGLTLSHVVAGLQVFSPPAGRLQCHVLPSGVTVVDDSYNANPDSLRVALQWLGQQPGQRWLVLGDMMETGQQEILWHRLAGQWARRIACSRLYTVGTLAANAARGFGAGHCFDESEQLLQALLAESLPTPLTILVKGSRRMGMEKIVQGLLHRV